MYDNGFGFGVFLVIIYFKVTDQSTAVIAPESGQFSVSKFLNTFAMTGSTGPFVSSL